MKYRRLKDTERRLLYRRWKRVESVLHRIPAPAVSEGFVRGVMSQVEFFEYQKTEAFSVLSRWLFPAFALAVASLTLSVAVPLPTEMKVSTDSLLFSQEAEARPSQRAFSIERSGEDPVFGDFLENQ